MSLLGVGGAAKESLKILGNCLLREGALLGRGRSVCRAPVGVHR